MKNLKNKAFYAVISLVAVLAVGSMVKAFVANGNVTIENYNEAPRETGENVSLGAQSGPDHYQKQYFHDSYQAGGERHATSSTAATYTLTASDGFDGEHYFVDWTPNVNVTLTTMASSSMPWLGKSAGSRETMLLRNASTTAAATITMAAGTGIDIQHGDATGDDLVIDGLDMAELEFIRKSNTDVIMLMRKYTEGD